MSERLLLKETENNKLVLKTENYEVEISLSDKPYSPNKPFPKSLKIPSPEKGIIITDWVDDNIVLLLPDQRTLILQADGGMTTSRLMTQYLSHYSLTSVYSYKIGGGYYVIVQVRYTNPEARKQIPATHC